MKKILLTLLLIIMIACSSKNNIITLKDTFIDKEHETTLTFDGNLNLSNRQISKPLRDSIIAAVLGSDFAKYSNNKVLRKYAKASLETFVETTDSTLIGATLYSKIDGEIVYADENYITFRRIMSTNIAPENQGLMTICNYYVFDAKTGRHLQEKDLFSPQTMNIIRKLLVKQAKEMATQNEIEIDLNKVRPNGNFAIMSSSIVYTFNPYEIAHPEIGFIDIVLINKEKYIEIEP